MRQLAVPDYPFLLARSRRTLMEKVNDQPVIQVPWSQRAGEA